MSDEREHGDAICVEDDGCPTEVAVLKRFWREHQSLPGLNDAERVILDACIEWREWAGPILAIPPHPGEPHLTRSQTVKWNMHVAKIGVMTEALLAAREAAEGERDEKTRGPA